MSFPNFKNKHLWDSMISPREFIEYEKKQGRGYKGPVPKGVIFCYDSRLLGYVIESHPHTKKTTARFGGDFYIVGGTKNKIGLIANFGIGAPVAATVMEELIAIGVRRFISIGSAGTLQKHIKIGDIVVCDKAIRDEGTSFHYLKPSKYSYASSRIVNKIGAALKKTKKKYVIGTSWTIDAPYRETVAEARRYQKEGVATVEMEAAALFAVGQFRKVDVGAIFSVSDSLAELVWDPQFHNAYKERGLLFEVAKEALL